MSAPELLRWFDEHGPALYRFAYRLTGSEADAEDIVQESFLSLLRPGSAFDPRRAPVRTYLFGVVRNQALKRLRRRETAADDDPPEPADGQSGSERLYERIELSSAEFDDAPGKQPRPAGDTVSMRVRRPVL